MKKKRGLLKRIGCFAGKYINGANGAISLLLVLVMSPLLSVAVLLVESARYQSAVQLMEEITGSSAFSTLSGYDSYLDKRFGLLSVSQENDINGMFSGYLNNNLSALGKSVTVNAQSATGKYALANTDILKQQLLEYSEISVAAEMVTEGIDLDILIEKLEEALDLKDIKKQVEAVNAGVDLAVEIEKLLEGITDAKKQYNEKYAPALSAYKNAYSDFEEKSIILVEVIEAVKADLADGDVHEDVYDDSGVKDAIKQLKKTRDVYKEATSTLRRELSTLRGYIDVIVASVNNLPSKLEKFDNKNSENTLAEECTTSTYEWLKIIADQITTTLNILIGGDFKDRAAREIEALEKQVMTLENLDEATIKSEFEEICDDTENITDTDEKESKRKQKIQVEYGMVSITCISNSFGTAMDSLISLLDEKAAVNSNSSAQMGSLLDIVSQLLGVSGLYNSNLDSVVNASYLHTNTSMSYSAQLTIDSLTGLIDACESFADGITSLNVIKEIKSLVKLLKSVAVFLGSIIAWVTETLFNLWIFITSGPKEWYNSLLLYGYAAYNLPNRTNYSSSKTVSGYSYNNIYRLAGGMNTTPTISGALKDLATIGDTSGTDRMFKGAEAEYILVGSKSELQNQSVAFFNLYLFRLVLDFIPVLKNAEVSTISAAAGPGAWVVKLAIALAEPMLDTIILVNGGKEYLIKKTVYLSFSGLVILQNDLVGVTSISKNLQDKIKDTIKEHNGKPAEKGWLDASYTEHMLLLMLLSVNQQTYMQRMQNLIQMEAATNYKPSFAFDLDHAYTYIYTDVTYTLNPMFNIDSLTENGLFTATSKRYTGY